MARAAQQVGLTPGEFLRWEREQSTRHEYFRGQLFAMAGGSIRHNALCVRVSARLLDALSTRGYHVLSSEQRIGIDRGERYVYPDVTVVCGAPQFEEGLSDVLANPQIIVEVLSASTEQYDRGMKWEGYQQIPALVDYVLVSQAEPRIEHFRRESDGSWVYRAVGPGGRITLGNGAVLDVEAIFLAGVFELAGD